LEGLQRLLTQNGFSDCKASDEAITKYQSESNSVATFLVDENYKADANNWQYFKEFYGDYKTFCQDDNYRAVSKREFAKRLKNLGIEIDKGVANKTIVFVSN
jgi:putative DNA primase/helicase